MEKMLLKLARQLDSLDEASLMALWSKYATITSHFEPTKRWEEACLVLSLIQAKRWKNQLFNYAWKDRRDPGVPPAPPPKIDLDFGLQKEEEAVKNNVNACRVLAFKPSGENDDKN